MFTCSRVCLSDCTVRVLATQLRRRAAQLVRRNRGRLSVPITSIDTLNLTACHFIKIDAEYMEYQVLRGAVRTIRRYRPHLFVENESPLRSEFDAHDR